MNWIFTGDSPVPSSLEPWKEKNHPHEGGKEKQKTHMQALQVASVWAPSREWAFETQRRSDLGGNSSGQRWY